MKKAKTPRPSASLTPEAHRHLIAYTTAAGLGAFFGGQAAEGQVTQSQGLAPYPYIKMGSAISNSFSILGDGVTDFQFIYTGHAWAEGYSAANGGAGKGYGAGYYGSTYPPKFSAIIYGIPKFSYLVGGFHKTPANFLKTTNNFVLDPAVSANPLAPGYPVPWTVGAIVDSNAVNVGYQQYGGQIANGFHNAFPSTNGFGALGFTFVRMNGNVTNRYYGYMVLEVVGTNYPDYWEGGYTAVVTSIYYNATPGVGIKVAAVPALGINVTGIKVGPGSTVTINFTSSNYESASSFTLQKSASVGASASWTTDGSAVITSSTPGVYQAVTTGSGGVLFYRINK